VPTRIISWQFSTSLKAEQCRGRTVTVCSARIFIFVFSFCYISRVFLNSSFIASNLLSIPLCNKTAVVPLGRESNSLLDLTFFYFVSFYFLFVFPHPVFHIGWCSLPMSL
jgi:hypothetical protein